MAVWYSLWSSGIFFLFWSVCTKKNLAILAEPMKLRSRFKKTESEKLVGPLKTFGVETGGLSMMLSIRVTR
jgi:hypothetical protein